MGERVLLVLGVVLLAYAVKQWRGRPRAGEESPTPGWMSTMDDFTPVKAAERRLRTLRAQPEERAA